MNPAMAGLGALTQQNSQPTGRSPDSMAQTMSLAKQMSDMQLADVLAGKSMDIPQYVAMTEAMGRKQLRTAMQGVTAMGSAKQPTEREKLLSEMAPRQQPQTMMSVPPQGAGLDQLPADNMQGLGHADGGIIAFKDGEGVKDPSVQREEDLTALSDIWNRIKATGSDIGDRALEGPRDVVNLAKRGFNLLPFETKLSPTEKPAPFAANRELNEAQIAREGVDPTDASDFLKTLKPTAPASATTPGATSAKTNAGAGPSTGGGAGYGGSLAGTDLSRFAEKQAELLRPKERNKDYYEALTKPIEDIAKQVASGKEQAQGEFLMQLGAKLMTVPNIGVAVGKGVEAGLPGLAASRKEINALTKDQRDYQFNIAKAKEARDQGDEMLALNYLKLAEESKYHMGVIGVGMARNSLDKTWTRANITAQQGIKDWKDLRVGERQELQQQGITPYNYFQFVNSGGSWMPTVSEPPDKAQVLQLPKP